MFQISCEFDKHTTLPDPTTVTSDADGLTWPPPINNQGCRYNQNVLPTPDLKQKDFQNSLTPAHLRAVLFSIHSSLSNIIKDLSQLNLQTLSSKISSLVYLLDRLYDQSPSLALMGEQIEHNNPKLGSFGIYLAEFQSNLIKFYENKITQLVSQIMILEKSTLKSFNNTLEFKSNICEKCRMISETQISKEIQIQTYGAQMKKLLFENSNFMGEQHQTVTELKDKVKKLLEKENQRSKEHSQALTRVAETIKVHTVNLKASLSIFQQFEGEVYEENEKLERQNIKLIDEIDKLRDEMLVRNEEIKLLAEKVSKLNRQLANKQRDSLGLDCERIRVQGIVQGLISQIEENAEAKYLTNEEWQKKVIEHMILFEESEKRATNFELLYQKKEREVSTLTSKISSLQIRITQSLKSLNIKREHANQAKEKNRNLQRDCRLKERQIQALEAEVASFRLQVNEKKEREKELMNMIENMQAEAKKRIEKEQNERKIIKKEIAQEVQDLIKVNEDLAKEKRRWQEKCREFKEELLYCIKERDSAREQGQELKQFIKSLQDVHKKIKKNVDEVQEANKFLQNQLKNQEDRVKEVNNQIEDLKREKANQEAEIIKLTKEADSLKGRLSSFNSQLSKMIELTHIKNFEKKELQVKLKKLMEYFNELQPRDNVQSQYFFKEGVVQKESLRKAIMTDFKEKSTKDSVRRVTQKVEVEDPLCAQLLNLKGCNLLGLKQRTGLSGKVTQLQSILREQWLD